MGRDDAPGRQGSRGRKEAGQGQDSTGVTGGLQKAPEQVEWEGRSGGKKVPEVRSMQALYIASFKFPTKKSGGAGGGEFLNFYFRSMENFRHLLRTYCI